MNSSAKPTLMFGFFSRCDGTVQGQLPLRLPPPRLSAEAQLRSKEGCHRFRLIPVRHMPRSGNEVDRGPVWQGGHLLPGDDPILKAEDHAHGNPKPIKIPYDVDPLAPVPAERFGKPQEAAPPSRR